MKKILFTLLFLFFPCASFAQLDVYLSTQNLPYGKDVWTSPNYPDSGSSDIQIERYFYREDFPSEYIHTPEEIKSLLDNLFSASTPEQQQDYYNSLISFEKQDLAQYIAIALSADIESDIADKQANSFLLSPFESTFQNCGINLVSREAVVKNLIEEIYAGIYPDVDALQYNDIRFGDCIIPFPDTRRGSSVIADSFPSNKLIAESLGGSPLRFGSLEDSVNLFSLADVTLEGLYEGVQANNLLDLQSTRVEQTTDFEKETGQSKVLFIHQNHYINPFVDALITGNGTIGYTIGGVGYDTNHTLFIQSVDSEEKRTFSPWQEVQEGIYRKTLLQEDTFELVGGIYIPKQSVGVTTYYAVLYKHDTTPPECPSTLFSHESAGNENFIFPEYPWFGAQKYGYFVCLDEQSGCFCDSSSIGCFVKDDIVLSIPQEIPHSGGFQYTFENAAGLSQACNSPVEQQLFYDKISPDVHITLPGVPEASLLREYVNNNGVLYDGIQITEKRFYHIENDLSFQADDGLAIELELYDPYDNTKTQEGVSGLSSYTLNISEFEDENWVQKVEQNHSFEDYNPLGAISAEHSYTIDFQTLENIEDVITKIGSYQVYIDIQDAAGNQSRVIFYFTITSASVDAMKSTFEIGERSILYADNTSSYIYTLTLRDEYFNPIEGREILSIEQYCTSVPNCLELRLDMTGAVPSGEQALEIHDFNTLSNQNGEINFSVRSRAPGIFTESFMVYMLNPDISVLFSSQNNTFLHPLEATLEAKISSEWLSDSLPVNQLREYRVHIEDTQSFGYAWSLSNFGSYLHARHPDTEFILSGPLTTQSDGVYFSGTFTSSLSPEEKHKTLLEIVDGTNSAVELSYFLDGKLVTYPLYSNNVSPYPLQLGNTGELQNPVRIIGNLQGVGNTHNLTEKQNFTAINSNNNRNTFRKNIGTHINTQQEGTTIGGVKYIDKTYDSNKLYTLESHPDFETLVVRNGNIHIKDDFNTSGEPIGIVSYIDSGYSKENGFESIGNIYVEPEVNTINAFIYADGGLISTQYGSPISGDTLTRNSILQNQLSIVGSLFTRNTLAGATELSGEYMLPGEETTTNQSLAIQYDLYHTRRGTAECLRDIYGFCDIPEYLILEYDSRIFSNPPKLFSN